MNKIPGGLMNVAAGLFLKFDAEVEADGKELIAKLVRRAMWRSDAATLAGSDRDHVLPSQEVEVRQAILRSWHADMELADAFARLRAGINLNEEDHQHYLRVNCERETFLQRAAEDGEAS